MNYFMTVMSFSFEPLHFQLKISDRIIWILIKRRGPVSRMPDRSQTHQDGIIKEQSCGSGSAFFRWVGSGSAFFCKVKIRVYIFLLGQILNSITLNGLSGSVSLFSTELDPDPYFPRSGSRSAFSRKVGSGSAFSQRFGFGSVVLPESRFRT